MSSFQVEAFCKEYLLEKTTFCSIFETFIRDAYSSYGFENTHFLHMHNLEELYTYFLNPPCFDHLKSFTGVRDFWISLNPRDFSEPDLPCRPDDSVLPIVLSPVYEPTEKPWDTQGGISVDQKGNNAPIIIPQPDIISE